MSNLAYRGRHRPRRSARLRQTALGAGLVLPTTALVSVAAAGSGAGPMALTGSRVQTIVSPTLGAASGEAVPTADALLREVEDRAARDTERRRLDVVSAESSRRAAFEAALAANEQVLDVATVPAEGGGTEGAAAPAAATAAPAPAAGAKAWVKPLNGGYRMTSGFGARWGSMHPAQDFATPVGTPVKALSSGTVIFAGWQGGYGYKLEIQFWDGTVAWYAHNSSLKVAQGQSVTAGQVVAASGDTGHSTGPHVHLEIHPGGGNPVPPLPWLARHGIGM